MQVKFLMLILFLCLLKKKKKWWKEISSILDFEFQIIAMQIHNRMMLQGTDVKSLQFTLKPSQVRLNGLNSWADKIPWFDQMSKPKEKDDEDEEMGKVI